MLEWYLERLCSKFHDRRFGCEKISLFEYNNLNGTFLHPFTSLIMTVIEKASSVDLFRLFLDSFDSLAKGEEPKGSEALPSNIRLSQKFSGEQITVRVENLLRKIFYEKGTSSIPAAGFKALLEKWTQYVAQSKKFTPQEKKRVCSRIVQVLFSQNLQYSPFKVIEVLQKRTADSLNGMELRALERSLASIVFAHENFKDTLYSFYLTHLGALFGLQAVRSGGKLKVHPLTNSIFIAWEKIPLCSPEAITIAAQIQAAEKNQTIRKTLKEFFEDLCSLDEESRMVVTVCAADYLWDCVAAVDDSFWDRVTVASTKECSNKEEVFHPFIRRSLEALDAYWFDSDIGGEEQRDGYDIEASSRKKKRFLEELMCCARCYQARFNEIALLYEKGIQLYDAARAACKIFMVETTVDFPKPEDFSRDAPHIPPSLDFAVPSRLEDMIPLILKSSDEREEAFLSLIFQSPEIGKNVLKRLYVVEAAKESPRCEWSGAGDFSRSFLPEHLLKPVKKERVIPRPKKKKLTTLVRHLSLASEPSSSAPEPLPVTKTVALPKRIQITIKPCSPWVTPTCVEGSEVKIEKELGLPHCTKQAHVQKMFAMKAKATVVLTKKDQYHLYPTFIASLVQKNTEARLHYSEHRSMDDYSYSCVGTWHDYGRGKKPVLGRYTEGFFAEDNVDGKCGELFHHCFYENSSEECLAKFRQNAAFDTDSDIEDVSGEVDQRSIEEVRPFARFRVTFKTRSCTVDDLVEQVLYTISFSRKIVLHSV